MIKRPRFKQTISLDERLADQAKRWRAEAEQLPPGVARDELMLKAHQADTGSDMNKWLTSPNLRPPAPYTDTENAKRFRDKAAEALQLIDLAQTESRRSALQHIVDHYNRAADQLEGLANLQARLKK